MPYRSQDVPFRTLAEALGALTVPELRAAAIRIHRHPPPHKAELLQLVQRHLGDMAGLRAAVDALDDLGRTALSEAAHGSGELRPRGFAAKYGSVPTRDDSWLGVMFFGDWRLPDDLRASLRRMLPPPRPADLTGLADPPPPAAGGARAVRLTERCAAADLLAVLRLCDGGGLHCSEQTRLPSASTVRAVGAVLLEGDFYPETPIAAFAWPLLLQAGALAELAGGRLQLTRRGHQALQAPAPEVLRWLWQQWVAHGVIDEFSRIEAIQGQQSSGGRTLTPPAPRRRAVQAALAEAPPGRWIGVDLFFTHTTIGHDFEVARSEWSLYVEHSQQGNLGYRGNGGWSVIQGRFTLCLLLEYAATLGLIDVAYRDPDGARDDYRRHWAAGGLRSLSRYDGLEFFRLNALGAYCLGVAAEAAPAPPQPAAGRHVVLRVLPNLDVVSLGERVPPADRLLLERYAATRSEGVWSLRRDLLLAALARGAAPDELESFLQARTEPPIPDPVLALLAEVRERAGRLRDLGSLQVIECIGEPLAQTLANDRRLRGLCLALGERHLAVRPADADAFAQALWAAGYTLPRAPGAPPAAAEERGPGRRRGRASGGG